jgi:hypothetical protein
VTKILNPNENEKRKRKKSPRIGHAKADFRMAAGIGRWPRVKQENDYRGGTGRRMARAYD